MASNRESWKTECRHDDACSSGSDSNAKATQIISTDLSDIASSTDLTSDDDLDRTCAQPNAPRPQRGLSALSIDAIGGIFQGGRCGTACHSTLQPSIGSIRHRYLVDTSIPHTASTTLQTTSNMDNTTGFVQKLKFNPHSSSLEREAMESLLNDVQERCQNSDEINQQLERKLHQKNQQLSQNCLLLAQSNESIGKLQSQLDEERREKTDLRMKLKVLMQEKNELETVREERQVKEESLHQKIKQVEQKLEEKSAVATSLQREVEELKSQSQRTLEESEHAIKQLENEAKAATEVINSQKSELAQKCELVKKLEETCTKEEKTRKQAEREVELVTQQGQSLLEQQSLMRGQYKEDLLTHQTKITDLEKLLANKEDQCEKITEELCSQEQKTLKIKNLLKENEDLCQQRISCIHDELRGVYQQVEDEKRKTEMLQQQMQQLKVEHAKTETDLAEEKRRLTSTGESHMEEITNLQRQHAQEMNEWQQKKDEAVDSERKSLELKQSEFKTLKNNFEKEVINLKCRIAELEDKLEQRTKSLSKLKDKLTEQAASEEQAQSKIKEIQSNLDDLKVKHEAEIKAKEQEIQRLEKTINKLEKQIDDLKETMAEHENEAMILEQLRCTATQLTAENNELNRQVLAGKEQISSLQNDCAVTRQSVEEISGIMRAKLSKKESSKAILVAEQQRLEREYSIALSLKAEELVDMENEIRTLQQENRALKQMRGSIAISNNDPIGKSAALIAKKHSSNQILAAENAKIREDLKSANTWWTRDINELQRRQMAQTGALGEIERRMTLLEVENIQLKQEGGITEDRASSLGTSTNSVHSKNCQSTNFENLLDSRRNETNIKETTITKLEASMLSAKGETNAALSKLEAASEQKQVMTNGLEGKLSQNEMDVEKIKLDLTTAEKLLAKNDHEGAECIIRKSNAEIQVLLENIKSANQSATSTMKLAADTHSSLIELHNQFSATLDRVRQDAEAASIHQKQDIEAMEKRHEQQLDKLYDNMQKQATEYTLQSQRLVCVETEKAKVDAKLQRAEEKLQAMETEVVNIKQALEVVQASKSAADNYVYELEEKLEKSSAMVSQLEGSIHIIKTDDSIIKERELSDLKAKHESRIAKVEDIHRKTIDELNSRVKTSEKENLRLLAEINSLHEKVSKNSETMEEVCQLHAEIQKLTIEKSEMQDRFKEGLSTLKLDQDLLLQERKNENERLVCQISELKAKCETIHEQYEKYKAQALALDAELQQTKSQNIEEVHKLKLALQSTEEKVNALTESNEREKQHLAKTLENTTKLEIEAVKLKNSIEKEGRQRQELLAAHSSEKKLIQQSLNEKISENKQLLADKKCLKLSVKSLGAEIQLLEEQGAIAKQDLEHAESVCQIYRNKIEAVRRDSEPLLMTDNVIKLSQTSISPIKHSTSVNTRCTTRCTSRIMETDGDLGVRTAELTNKVGELEHINQLLRKKLELTQEQQLESIKENMKNKSSLHTVVSQRDYHMNAYNALNQEHMRLQLELRTRQIEQEGREEEVVRLKSVKNSIQKENDALTKQIKDNKVMKDVELDTKALRETEQLRNYNERLNKMSEERISSLELEQAQRLQLVKLQNEITLMKEQLDDAFDANKSLEKYIKNLRKSFNQLFENEDAAIANRKEGRVLRRSQHRLASKTKPDRE